VYSAIRHVVHASYIRCETYKDMYDCTMFFLVLLVRVTTSWAAVKHRHTTSTPDLLCITVSPGSGIASRKNKDTPSNPVRLFFVFWRVSYMYITLCVFLYCSSNRRAAAQEVVTNKMHKRQKKRSIASTSTKRRKRKKRLPRAAVYTLQERWDLPRVRELVDRLPSDHRDLKILTHVSTHADPVSGLLAVDYYYSQNRASGRLYASNSCQRLSRPVRSFCTQDRYIDLDIRKSFPTMLLRICEDNGLDPQKLRDYVTRGDDVINGILDEQKQAGGRTPLVYEDVKKAFLVSLHCGDYRSLITQGRQVDELEEFAAEMKEVATELYTRSRYKSVRDHVEAQKGGN
jgi:hypothetical protein